MIQTSACGAHARAVALNLTSLFRSTLLHLVASGKPCFKLFLHLFALSFAGQTPALAVLCEQIELVEFLMTEGSMDVNHSGLRQKQTAPGGAQKSQTSFEWEKYNRDYLTTDGAVVMSTSEKLGTEVAIGELHTGACLMSMPSQRRLSYIEFTITEGEA